MRRMRTNVRPRDTRGLHRRDPPRLRARRYRSWPGGEPELDRPRPRLAARARAELAQDRRHVVVDRLGRRGTGARRCRGCAGRRRAARAPRARGRSAAPGSRASPRRGPRGRLAAPRSRSRRATTAAGRGGAERAAARRGRGAAAPRRRRRRARAPPRTGSPARPSARRPARTRPRARARTARRRRASSVSSTPARRRQHASSPITQRRAAAPRERERLLGLGHDPRAVAGQPRRLGARHRDRLDAAGAPARRARAPRRAAPTDRGSPRRARRRPITVSARITGSDDARCPRMTSAAVSAASVPAPAVELDAGAVAEQVDPPQVELRIAGVGDRRAPGSARRADRRGCARRAQARFAYARSTSSARPAASASSRLRSAVARASGPAVRNSIVPIEFRAWISIASSPSSRASASARSPHVGGAARRPRGSWPARPCWRRPSPARGPRPSGSSSATASWPARSASSSWPGHHRMLDSERSRSPSARRSPSCAAALQRAAAGPRSPRADWSVTKHSCERRSSSSARAAGGEVAGEAQGARVLRRGLAVRAGRRPRARRRRARSAAPRRRPRRPRRGRRGGPAPRGRRGRRAPAGAARTAGRGEASPRRRRERDRAGTRRRCPTAPSTPHDRHSSSRADGVAGQRLEQRQLDRCPGTIAAASSTRARRRAQRRDAGEDGVADRLGQLDAARGERLGHEERVPGRAAVELRGVDAVRRRELRDGVERTAARAAAGRSRRCARARRA